MLFYSSCLETNSLLWWMKNPTQTVIWHKQAWADSEMNLLWEVPYINVPLPTVSSSISKCHMVLWTNSPLCRTNSTWKTQKSDTSVLNSPEFNHEKNSIQPAGVGNTKKRNAGKPFVLHGVNYTAWQPLLWSTCTKGPVSLSCSAELIPPAITQQSPQCQQSGIQEYLWWGQWCTEHAEGTSTCFTAVDQPFGHQHCSCLVFF